MKQDTRFASVAGEGVHHISVRRAQLLYLLVRVEDYHMLSILRGGSPSTTEWQAIAHK